MPQREPEPARELARGTGAGAARLPLADLGHRLVLFGGTAAADGDVLHGEALGLELLDADPRGALADHVDLLRRGARQVYDTAAGKGAAVVHPDDRAAPVLEIGHPHDGGHLQGTMGGGPVGLVVALAVGGRLAVEARPYQEATPVSCQGEGLLRRVGDALDLVGLADLVGAALGDAAAGASPAALAGRTAGREARQKHDRAAQAKGPLEPWAAEIAVLPTLAA